MESRECPTTLDLQNQENLMENSFDDNKRNETTNQNHKSGTLRYIMVLCFMFVFALHLQQSTTYDSVTETDQNSMYEKVAPTNSGWLLQHENEKKIPGNHENNFPHNKRVFRLAKELDEDDDVAPSLKDKSSEKKDKKQDEKISTRDNDVDVASTSKDKDKATNKEKKNKEKNENTSLEDEDDDVAISGTNESKDDNTDVTPVTPKKEASSENKGKENKDEKKKTSSQNDENDEDKNSSENMDKKSEEEKKKNSSQDGGKDEDENIAPNVGDKNTSLKTNGKDNKSIENKFENRSENENLGNSNLQKTNNTTIAASTIAWHEQINIPYVEKDSLHYDIIIGCIFAAVFTAVVLVSSCVLNQCFDCDCFCCFDSQNPDNWNKTSRPRKRYKLGESYGIFSYFKFNLLPQDESYDNFRGNDEINYKREKRALMAQSVDSWDTDTEDFDRYHPSRIGRDPDDGDDDRLEYGESVGDYDDEVDYDLINNQKGRYEKDQIEAAARTYFDEERVHNFFSDKHTVDEDSDSDSDGGDSPLDLEMIEKKMVNSINNAKASTSRKIY